MIDKIKNMFKGNKENNKITAIEKLPPELLNGVMERLLKLEGSYELPNLTYDKVGEMLNDIDIAFAVRKLNLALEGREWKIKCINELEQNDLSKEIEKRLSKIDLYKFINDIHNIKYYGYGAFEVVYEQDYSIKKIQNIPQDYILYDNEKGWYANIGDEIYLDNPFKFLVFKNKDTLKSVMGKSELKPLQEKYEAKKSITSKMRGIADRYGDIIVVFAYDPNEDEEDIKARGQELKNLKGRNAIGIPVWDGSLKDSVHFISLSDLNTEMHNVLEDRWKVEMQKFLLGADYSSSMSSTGSYSRDSTQQSEQEKQEESLLKFVRECFQSIIKIDGQFYGYDYSSYVISFDKEVDKEKQIDIRKKEVETNKIVFETIKSLGYDITKEYISEKYGIPIENILENESTVESKEFARVYKKRDYNR